MQIFQVSFVPQFPKETWLQREPPNIDVWPESLGATLKYWYIARLPGYRGKIYSRHLFLTVDSYICITYEVLLRIKILQVLSSGVKLLLLHQVTILNNPPASFEAQNKAKNCFFVLTSIIIATTTSRRWRKKEWKSTKFNQWMRCMPCKLTNYLHPLSVLRACIATIF